MVADHGEKMKAVQTDKAGGPEVMYYGEHPKAFAGPGKVLIKVHATALNGADLSQRAGHYPPPEGGSNVMGLEASGEVEEVGEGVTGFKVGEKVMSLLDGGGYSEYVATAEELVMHMPDHLSYEQAAAIPEVWLTAFLELVWLGDLHSGEDLIIHAGASGVGTAAIQIAKALGARVFVTAGSDDKLQLCKELGADVLIDYKTQDFVEVVKEHTQGNKRVATGVPGTQSGRTQDWGVDVILDLVGGVHFAKSIDALALQGRLLIVGLGGGSKAEIDLAKLMQKRLKVIGSSMRARTLEQKGQLIKDFSKFALDKFREGEFKPVVDKVFPISEVREAHEYMEDKKNKGKIVLKVL